MTEYGKKSYEPTAVQKPWYSTLPSRHFVEEKIKILSRLALLLCPSHDSLLLAEGKSWEPSWSLSSMSFK